MQNRYDNYTTYTRLETAHVCPFYANTNVIMDDPCCYAQRENNCKHEGKMIINSTRLFMKGE